VQYQNNPTFFVPCRLSDNCQPLLRLHHQQPVAEAGCFKRPGHHGRRAGAIQCVGRRHHVIAVLAQIGRRRTQSRAYCSRVHGRIHQAVAAVVEAAAVHGLLVGEKGGF